MSSSGGFLRCVHVVHWEQMRWFPRGITPTDSDGLFDHEQLSLFSGPVYMVEAGWRFAFFEFKHETAYISSDSGQVKAIERFRRYRLQAEDIVVWVRHDATGSDTRVDIYPENITTWTAYGCGERTDESQDGVGWESLRDLCHRWSR